MKNKRHHSSLDNLHFNTKLLYDEVKRRKIKTHIVPFSQIVIAELKGHIEVIDHTDLSCMPASLRTFLDNKYAVKVFLDKLHIPVSKGRLFQTSDLRRAKKYARNLFPVVIKPVVSCFGVGVRMNIESDNEFEAEFRKLRNSECYAKEILIEKQFDGLEFRLTALKNGFFAAVHRSCPKVIGDGVSSIRELIEKENHLRMNPRSTCLCSIWNEDGEIDRYLAKKNLTLHSIPRKFKVVYLRSNSNVSTGGECIDVTDIVHPFYKKLAFDILTKIQGLPYAGIDLITADITQYNRKTKYVICEINSSPGISLHTHPSHGKSRDLPATLIDLIFPETARDR